jgi:hypothetical protein
MPHPRRNIFGSVPRAGKVAESIHAGRLSVGTAITLGSVAHALVFRVGASQLANRVTVAGSVVSGGKTFDAQTRNFPKESLVPKSVIGPRG